MVRGLWIVTILAAVVAASVQAAPSPRPALATSCGPIDDGDPQWAPAGKTIAFVRRTRDASAIYRIGADGTGLRRLSSTSDYALYPRWSPDGAHLAYETFDLGAVVHLVVADAAGRDAHVVASFQGSREPPDPELAWHPDGRGLAFVHDGWVFVAGGAEQQPQKLVAGSWPAWSPDASQLAYVTPDDRLALARTDGSGFRTVADHVVSPPRWSPDGKRLAFASEAGSDNWRVTVVDASTARTTLLDVQSTAPAWSPNGLRLVDYTVPRRTRWQLHVVDTRTRRVTTITRDRSTRFGADDLQPSWSPDGTTIAFASVNLASPGATMQGGELRLVDPAGRHERRLTYHCTGGITGGSPNQINGSWLPDLVLARDGVRDDVACGGGYDVVYAERRDRVRRDCESVRYAPSRRGT